MTPVEEFKIFLIRNDLPLSPALDMVRYNPALLDKFSMEELAIYANYLHGSLVPAAKQIKIKPILYNACQLAAMKSNKTLIDWLDETLFEATKEITNAEILHSLENVHRKITRK